MVGVPVPRKTHRNAPATLDALFGSSQILMRTITAEKLKQKRPDILVRPAVDDIRVLDFMKTRMVLESAAPLREFVKAQLSKLLEKAA
ncbi:hypothetical protein V6L77_16720 [Pannonibacter sp. Pt2-lr]